MIPEEIEPIRKLVRRSLLRGEEWRELRPKLYFLLEEVEQYRQPQSVTERLLSEVEEDEGWGEGVYPWPWPYRDALRRTLGKQDAKTATFFEQHSLVREDLEVMCSEAGFPVAPQEWDVNLAHGLNIAFDEAHGDIAKAQQRIHQLEAALRDVLEMATYDDISGTSLENAIGVVRCSLCEQNVTAHEDDCPWHAAQQALQPTAAPKEGE